MKARNSRTLPLPGGETESAMTTAADVNQLICMRLSAVTAPEMRVPSSANLAGARGGDVLTSLALAGRNLVDTCCRKQVF
jgi:hypothetical protein